MWREDTSSSSGSISKQIDEERLHLAAKEQPTLA
jgi:hypothetical protein